MPRRWRYFLALFPSVVALLCLELGCLATRPTLGESVPGSLFATRCESRIIRYGARTSGRSPQVGTARRESPLGARASGGAESPPRRRRREFSFDSVSHTGVGRVRKNRAGRMFIIWVAGDMFTIGFRGCDFHRRRTRTKRAANIVWIQLNIYAEVRTGLDWWICSLGVGAMTNPRRMNVKGTERGSMTELRQNVSAVFLIALERSGRVP